jgi:beta-glucanase (GH16 family)
MKPKNKEPPNLNQFMNASWKENINFINFNSSRWLKVHYAQHGEPQIYMDNTVSIRNGNLVIKMDDNPTYCPSNPPTVWGACWPCDNKWYSYTSGWVETQPSQNVQYGLIQARIKLPYGRGFWPAFWTFVGGGLPSHSNAAEIDIFEMLGHLPSNIITTNIHTNYGNEPNNYQEANMGNYANTYHNYAVAWSPLKIVWYVDGNPIRISTNHGIVDPVRIILNFAIEPGYLPNSSTPFPSEMLVDYVKVHQLRNDCASNLNIDSSNDFNSLDHRVKNSITINNAISTIKVPGETSVYLRADQSFQIKSSFSVPLGSSFFVDVNSCH